MNREEFGMLVKALRTEVIMLPEGRPMTQQELAKKTMHSPRTIGQIEQGDKRNLEPQIIASLADAFGLTSMERTAFYAAAAQVDIDPRSAIPGDPADVLKMLIKASRTIQIPAFIYDSLYTIVAANSLMLKLSNVQDSLIESGHESAAGFNLLRYYFVDDSPFPSVLGPGWERFAIRNVQHFRASSLQYRHTKQFDLIFSELCKYDRFQDFWARTRYVGEDIFYNWEGVDYHHPEYGHMTYIVSEVPTLTGSEDLYLVSYIPRNKQTTIVFQEMVSQLGANMHRLGKWPYDDGEAISAT